MKTKKTYKIRSWEFPRGHYIMSEGAQTIIYTKDKSYRSEKLLKEWDMELDQRLFIRCHRSFLVNLSKIVQLEKNFIYLYLGYKVPLSIRKKKRVEEAFMIYDTRYR